jgi:hypothetical protein
MQRTTIEQLRAADNSAGVEGVTLNWMRLRTWMSRVQVRNLGGSL